MKKIFHLIPWFLSLCFMTNISAQQGVLFKIEKSCFQGIVEFELKNVGTNITPQDSIHYIVIEDEIIARQGQIDSLGSGEVLTISLPALGEKYNLDLLQGNNQAPFTSGNLVCSISQTNLKMQRWAIGFQAGTLGPGIAVEKQFNNRFSLRASGTYLPYDFEWPSPYDFSNLAVSTKVASAGLMLDWFVSGKPDALFHFTAGGVYNLSELNFLITPDEEWVNQSGFITSIDQVGYLDITAKPQKINPYLGIGIGRLGSAVKKIGGKFELGAYYLGAPEIQMKATGAVEPTASQEALIESNVSTYRWYPNINFIISFKL